MTDINNTDFTNKDINNGFQPTEPIPSKNIYKLLFYVFFILFLLTASVLLITLLRVNEPILNYNKTVSPTIVPTQDEMIILSPTTVPANYGIVTTSISVDGGVECYQNNKYFVALKNGQVAESRILVKVKTDENLELDCSYKLEPSDFEFVEWITMILDLHDNYLLTDTGTGPGCRGLHIYNLAKKEKIYEATYCSEKPNEVEFVDDNQITFWVQTTEEATQENCSNLTENEQNGWGSAIEEHILLNLLTLEKQSLEEYRCAARQ